MLHFLFIYFLCMVLSVIVIDQQNKVLRYIKTICFNGEWDMGTGKFHVAIIPDDAAFPHNKIYEGIT